MHLDPEGFFHLTYCTNIHSANGWDAVMASLERHLPPLRARLAGTGPFGIGLRLSDAEASTLAEPARLDAFRAYLAAQHSYVFTINGFPFGRFHGTSVKDEVYRPDWSRPERVTYTIRLAHLLATLLPGEIDGGISTCPLSYAHWFDPATPPLWDHYARHLATVVAELARIRRETGKCIHLDLEPEPDCLIEDSRSATTFFESHLLTTGAAELGRQLGLAREPAREMLREHLRICLDACHLAVVFEPPETFLQNLDRVGLRIGKIQLSSALRVPLPPTPAARQPLLESLRPFAESVYLHQTVERHASGALTRYADLDQALAQGPSTDASEWRIHFHVPIFLNHYGNLDSTQPQLRETLRLVRERRLCRHLEIETYTWDVLPTALRTDLNASIAREYAWVLDQWSSP